MLVLRAAAEFTSSQRGESNVRRQSGVGNAPSATKTKRSFAMAGIVDKDFCAGDSDEEEQKMRTP